MKIQTSFLIFSYDRFKKLNYALNIKIKIKTENIHEVDEK